MFIEVYHSCLLQLFLATCSISYATTITFSTTANTSNFIHLENFIGSIHAHAPTTAQIRIVDSGLTSTQRLLLSHYHNVDVVSSASTQTKVESVDRPVTDELIDYDNLIFNTRLDSKLLTFDSLPYIDSIRKRWKLAVVIPFIRSQISDVDRQLNRSTINIPCRSISSTDLIMYHNEDKSSSLNELILEIVDQYEPVIRKCYNRVRVFAADLKGENNSYFRGSGVMWRKLIDSDDELSLSSLGYSHFFLMEADTWPIRQYWLDGVLEQITEGRNGAYLSTSWWVTGSIYRGRSLHGSGHPHINGNALYHLSSNYISFVRFLWKFYVQNKYMGYDYILSHLVHNDIRRVTIWRGVMHKFRYSEFIQNCWNSGCSDDEVQYARDNPQTYLLHGGKRWPRDRVGRLREMDMEGTSFEQMSIFSFDSLLIIEFFAFSGMFFMVFVVILINYRWKYYIFVRRLVLSKGLLPITNKRSMASFSRR